MKNGSLFGAPIFEDLETACLFAAFHRGDVFVAEAIRGMASVDEFGESWDEAVAEVLGVAADGEGLEVLGF